MQTPNNTKNHRRTVVHSFRINEEWFSILCEEAKTQGISSNAFMNKILKDYCLNHRQAKRFDMICLRRSLFDKMISVNTEESLKEIAKRYGTIDTRDELLTLGITPTRKHLKFYITNILGEFGGWFNVTHYSRCDKEIFHLRHELGRKWSIFIAQLLSTILEHVLNEKSSVEVSDDFVTFAFPSKP
ncbi:MAG: hypothetical protein CW691_05605 [Candidatus Bathyarchaeum sp.]|nr:MAG: hypothetical protein CW691_05605 [Candidatus Bathyarchaeum sp.]